MMRFVLASQSPRRHELLALTGLDFSVVPTDIDETRRNNEPPPAYARRLSREKAQVAALSITGPALILAADTIVVDDDHALEKPRNKQHATEMLRSLRGRVHEVFTAITLIEVPNGRTQTDVCRSPVSMRAYADAEIAEYVATGDPLDKAGSYGIQHPDFQPVERFAHCFASVMGLPICHVTRLLREAGIEPSVDVPAACQAHIDYDCSIHALVLSGSE